MNIVYSYLLQLTYVMAYSVAKAAQNHLTKLMSLGDVFNSYHKCLLTETKQTAISVFCQKDQINSQFPIIVNLSTSLADLAPKGVRVNAVW